MLTFLLQGHHYARDILRHLSVYPLSSLHPNQLLEESKQTGYHGKTLKINTGSLNNIIDLIYLIAGPTVLY